MSETLSILLVDDDEIDVIAVQRVIRKHQITNPLYVAEDGHAALEMLRGTAEKSPLPQPLLILLDLNMPRMGGLDFLAELRSDDFHKHLPVYVLTTSDDPRDRSAADRLGVAGYLLKDDLDTRLVDLITGRTVIPAKPSNLVGFHGPLANTLPPEAISMIPGLNPLDLPEPLDVDAQSLIEAIPSLVPALVEVEPEPLDVVEPLPPPAAVDLLLIDDDEVDAMTLKRALSRRGQPHRLHVIADGVTALKRLRGVRGVEPLPRPLVILLDLGLPRMHGLEVLKELRRDPTLRHHVVFVLSTSEAPRDVADAYAGQIAGYLPKGRLGDGWDLMVDLLDAYLRIVQLPSD
jgi:CheY-like chemotaxis protein